MSAEAMEIARLHMLRCITHDDPDYECSCPDERSHADLALAIDALVAREVERERERCAKVCAAMVDSEPEVRNEDYENGYACARDECAAAIRAAKEDK